jgi:glutathione S-transferase
VNLKNKPDWFLERNPLGQTPVIEYKGHYIYESPICDEFLEDAFPANGSDIPELLPSCAFKRAAARLFMTLSDQKV